MKMETNHLITTIEVYKERILAVFIPHYKAIDKPEFVINENSFSITTIEIGSWLGVTTTITSKDFGVYFNIKEHTKYTNLKDLVNDVQEFVKFCNMIENHYNTLPCSE